MTDELSCHAFNCIFMAGDTTHPTDLDVVLTSI